MNEQRYVIKREDQPGRMLSGLGIGSLRPWYPDDWTMKIQKALQFNEDEAKATIEFITNVIDDYLGEMLYAEPVES